jgi:hypothetical protein
MSGRQRTKISKIPPKLKNVKSAHLGFRTCSLSRYATSEPRSLGPTCNRFFIREWMEAPNGKRSKAGWRWQIVPICLLSLLIWVWTWVHSLTTSWSKSSTGRCSACLTHLYGRTGVSMGKASYPALLRKWTSARFGRRGRASHRWHTTAPPSTLPSSLCRSGSSPYQRCHCRRMSLQNWWRQMGTVPHRVVAYHTGALCGGGVPELASGV